MAGGVFQPGEYSASSAKDYLSKKVDFKIEAYRKKGDCFRWGYLTMISVAVVSAAAVPVLIQFADTMPARIAATLLSLLVTILVTLEGSTTCGSTGRATTL